MKSVLVSSFRGAVLGILLLLLACSTTQSQQDIVITARSPSVADVTLCDIYEDPDRFTRTFVKTEGTILGRDLDDLWLDAFERSPCLAYMKVQLVTPDDARYSVDFELVRDSRLEQFHEALNGSVHIDGTFEGLFVSFVSVRNGTRVRSSGREAYDGQIILRRVYDIVTRPVIRF